MPTPSPARRAGFTLIELLVVIAIIAILTAIIFPVFATVRENARQQSSIAALHQIQTGIAEFKLDQGVYPPVLFGYALPTGGTFTYFNGARMDNALQLAETKNAAAQYFPGLYPEYVKNALTFTDGNNPTSDLSKTTGALTVNVLPCQSTNPPVNTMFPLSHIQTRADPSLPCNSSNVDTKIATNFYTADAFDTSPEITSTNQLSTTLNVVRYQTSWTDISPTAQSSYDSAPGATPTFVNYNRQLRWQNPPADTYVTSTTYHVSNDNRVLVLWESGDAQSIDASRFLTINGVGGSDSTSTYGAKFWQVSPTSNTNPGF